MYISRDFVITTLDVLILQMLRALSYVSDLNVWQSYILSILNQGVQQITWSNIQAIDIPQLAL